MLGITTVPSYDSLWWGASTVGYILLAMWASWCTAVWCVVVNLLCKR